MSIWHISVAQADALHAVIRYCTEDASSGHVTQQQGHHLISRGTSNPASCTSSLHSISMLRQCCVLCCGTLAAHSVLLAKDGVESYRAHAAACQCGHASRGDPDPFGQCSESKRHTEATVFLQIVLTLCNPMLQHIDIHQHEVTHKCAKWQHVDRIRVHRQMHRHLWLSPTNFVHQVVTDLDMVIMVEKHSEACSTTTE